MASWTMSTRAFLLCLLFARGLARTYRLGTNGYSPYTFEDASGNITGFGPEMARGMSSMCDDINIEIVWTPWPDCWLYDDSGIGAALENETVDACMTYSHTYGVRNVYADFGWAILNVNKAAGLLTRLVDGMPVVSSTSDLSDITVVDVGGWAPTPDTLQLTTNKCTDAGYSNFTIISADGNDAALMALLDGTADAMYVYSDQPKNFLDQCSAGNAGDDVDCDLWQRFGTDFAFVQTGKFGFQQNGTTLVMTKKGSGVDTELNACTKQFMESEEYYKLCQKYTTLTDDCYRNSFFSAGDTADIPDYMTPTDDLTPTSDYCSCATGYCPCNPTTCAPTPTPMVKTYRLGTNGYSPYTFKDASGNITGFGPEMARGMSSMCDDINIEIVWTPRPDCWLYDDSGIGAALENETVDACMTYSHTYGVRNVYADFGWAILNVNKAAGLLTRLVDGMPVVSSTSDLSDITVVDVGGWAPTPDTLQLTTNKCTDAGYSNFTIISADGNDAALMALLDGTADVMYVYSDQPKNFLDQCSAGNAGDDVDCDLWQRFGTDFAFVQTGKFGFQQNGTTLVMTKKGSGVDTELNACTKQFMESEEYYKLCQKYTTLTDDCYRNSFFSAGDAADTPDYMTPTDDLTPMSDYCSCATGYCPCNPTTCAPTPTPASTTVEANGDAPAPTDDELTVERSAAEAFVKHFPFLLLLVAILS